VRRARSPDEVEAALDLRREVFCVEQGVSLAADRDGRDGQAEQLVAVLDGVVVGTCRLLVENGLSRLGRMVVSSDMRGRGVGARLLREADRVTAELGIDRIVLHAQVPALGVYERAGYRTRGPVFLEEGIEHVPMEKRLA
jgi:predicted GNAT family N-acyltransferase